LVDAVNSLCDVCDATGQEWHPELEVDSRGEVKMVKCKKCSGLGGALPREARHENCEGDPNEHMRGMFEAIAAVPEGAVSLKRLLHGEYEFVTRCSACQTEVSRIETFDQIQVNFYDSGALTLSQVFDRMFAPEVLDGSNKYHCDTCATLTEATRRTYIRTFPEYMNVHVLRFNGPDKLLNPLDFHHYFHGDPDGPWYALVGAVVHVGDSLSTGHYLAHVRVGLDVPARWLAHNDSRAHPESAAVLTRSPIPENVYMLMYRRLEKGIVPARRDPSASVPPSSPTKRKPTTMDDVGRPATLDDSKRARALPDTLIPF
jgi:hypothetical protein